MLIIGSGSFTHDLSEFRCHNPNIPAPDLGQQFCRLVPCGADRRLKCIHIHPQNVHARLIVMRRIGGKNSPQVLLAEDEHLVQALADRAVANTHRPHPGRKNMLASTVIIADQISQR